MFEILRLDRSTICNENIKNKVHAHHAQICVLRLSHAVPRKADEEDEYATIQNVV